MVVLTFPRARLLSLKKPHLPTIEKDTRLVDLVGPRSWLLFNVLQIEGTFLNKATSEWEEDEEFFKFSRYARNLKVSDGVAPFFLDSRGNSMACKIHPFSKPQLQVAITFEPIMQAQNILVLGAFSQNFSIPALNMPYTYFENDLVLINEFMTALLIEHS